MRVALFPDNWFPRDRRSVECEIDLEAKVTGERVSGTFKGERAGVPVAGAVTGIVSRAVLEPRSALSRLRFENGLTDVARHMSRVLLDVSWKNGAASGVWMRCAYPWGRAARTESVAGRLTSASLALDVRTLIGMQPGGRVSARSDACTRCAARSSAHASRDAGP